MLRGMGLWRALMASPMAIVTVGRVIGAWYGPSAGGSYFAVIPPSATMTEPVTNDDSSEARKSATFAISRGSPGSPDRLERVDRRRRPLSRPPSISAWA